VRRPDGIFQKSDFFVRKKSSPTQNMCPNLVIVAELHPFLVVEISHGYFRSCEGLNENVRKKMRPLAKIFKICPEKIRPRQFGFQKFVRAAIRLPHLLSGVL
jgi:hypothetical protein